VVPFLATVRARYPELVISVDTWRAEVGRLACAEGADMLNDSWAHADPELAEVAAEFGVGVVCSHTGGARPRTRPHRVSYPHLVEDVIAELTGQAERMVALGVPKEGVLIDPTHDFGKNTWHGLELLRRCGELVATGWPVLMALSHKDFIGETLGVGLEERGEGTLAATALAAAAGARVFRAHDVAATRRTVDMVASIQGTRAPAGCIRGWPDGRAAGAVVRPPHLAAADLERRAAALGQARPTGVGGAAGAERAEHYRTHRGGHRPAHQGPGAAG